MAANNEPDFPTAPCRLPSQSEYRTFGDPIIRWLRHVAHHSLGISSAGMNPHLIDVTIEFLPHCFPAAGGGDPSTSPRVLVPTYRVVVDPPVAAGDAERCSGAVAQALRDWPGFNAAPGRTVPSARQFATRLHFALRDEEEEQQQIVGAPLTPTRESHGFSLPLEFILPNFRGHEYALVQSANRADIAAWAAEEAARGPVAAEEDAREDGEEGA